MTDKHTGCYIPHKFVLDELSCRLYSVVLYCAMLSSVIPAL